MKTPFLVKTMRLAVRHIYRGFVITVSDSPQIERSKMSIQKATNVGYSKAARSFSFDDTLVKDKPARCA